MDSNKIRIKGRKVKRHIKKLNDLNESDEEFLGCDNSTVKTKSYTHSINKLEKLPNQEDKTFGLKFHKLLHTGKVLTHWNDSQKMFVDMKLIEKTNNIINKITNAGSLQSLSNKEQEPVETFEKWPVNSEDESNGQIIEEKLAVIEKDLPRNFKRESNNFKSSNDNIEVANISKEILDKTIAKNDPPEIFSSINSWFSNISSATKIAASATKVAASVTMTEAAKQLVNAQNILLTNSTLSTNLNVDSPNENKINVKQNVKQLNESTTNDWENEWDDEPIVLRKKTNQTFHLNDTESISNKPILKEQSFSREIKKENSVNIHCDNWNDNDENGNFIADQQQQNQHLESIFDSKQITTDDGWNDWGDENINKNLEDKFENQEIRIPEITLETNVNCQIDRDDVNECKIENEIISNDEIVSEINISNLEDKMEPEIRMISEVEVDDISDIDSSDTDGEYQKNNEQKLLTVIEEQEKQMAEEQINAFTELQKNKNDLLNLQMSNNDPKPFSEMESISEENSLAEGISNVSSSMEPNFQVQLRGNLDLEFLPNDDNNLEDINMWIENDDLMSSEHLPPLMEIDPTPMENYDEVIFPTMEIEDEESLDNRVPLSKNIDSINIETNISELLPILNNDSLIHKSSDNRVPSNIECQELDGWDDEEVELKLAEKNSIIEDDTSDINEFNFNHETQTQKCFNWNVNSKDCLENESNVQQSEPEPIVEEVSDSIDAFSNHLENDAQSEFKSGSSPIEIFSDEITSVKLNSNLQDTQVVQIVEDIQDSITDLPTNSEDKTENMTQVSIKDEFPEPENPDVNDISIYEDDSFPLEKLNIVGESNLLESNVRSDKLKEIIESINDWNVDWEEEQKLDIPAASESEERKPNPTHKVVKKCQPSNELNLVVKDSTKKNFEKDIQPELEENWDDWGNDLIPTIDKNSKKSQQKVVTNKPKFNLVDRFDDKKVQTKSKPKFAQILDDWNNDNDDDWNKSFSNPTTKEKPIKMISSSSTNTQEKPSGNQNSVTAAMLAPANISSQQYQELYNQVQSKHLQSSSNNSWLEDFKTATKTAAVTTMTHAVKNWPFNPVSLFDSVVDNLSNVVGIPSAEEMAAIMRKQPKKNGK